MTAHHEGQPGPPPRFGRVEIAILDELSRSGGLTLREAALAAAFPALAGEPGQGSAAEQVRARRARAEAALSRAILSLERKGLISRERNPQTGRTLLRAAGEGPLPVWEQLAQAEEDLAAHCRRTARHWEALAGRARRRADRIRADRSPLATEAERADDLATIRRLEPRGQ